MGLFDKSTTLFPLEYPRWMLFVDAINNSYWVHSEYNFDSSVADYHAANHVEKSVIKNAMLAIAHIEVQVKRFWANFYNFIPKTEADDVGVTFGDSEVRHKRAYMRLLEILGLEEEFKKILEVPEIMDRVKYLTEIQEKKNVSREEYIFTVVLFSLFVEHISLFGQFLIMMSYNKMDNKFTGISNVIEATSKEEDIHGLFGMEVYNTAKQEYPEIFTEEFYGRLAILADKAQRAEIKIIEWIYSNGDSTIIPKAQVINYINHRFNKSMIKLGIKSRYDVDKELLSHSEWFDLEVCLSKEDDFFAKRPVSYSKNDKSVTADDLF